MNIKHIIRQVAKHYGISPAEVRKDMEEAMRVSMTSSDPVAMAHWKKIYSLNREPQLEDFIRYLFGTVLSDIN